MPAAGAAPPEVDLGDPRGLLSIVGAELAPTPGRLDNTVRLAAIALLTIVVGEVFRVPEIGLLAYVSFIVAGTDAGSTIRLALAGGSMLIAGTFASIVVLMASLSDAALRVPIMTGLIFATGFLSRAATAGQAFYVLGLWITYQLPSGDQIIASALEQSWVTGDTTDASIPDLAVMSPEESLVHTSLWTAFDFALALVIIVVVNLVVGRDPAAVLRGAIADRLGAAAALCERRPGSRQRLAALTRESPSKLLKLLGVAASLRRAPLIGVDMPSLIRAVDRLGLVVLAANRVAPGDCPRAIARTGRACRSFERDVRSAGRIGVAGGRGDLSASRDDAGDDPGEASETTPALLPLLPLVDTSLAALEGVLHRGQADEPDVQTPDQLKSHGFLVADAWSNPEYLQHGLKLTLAAMICYMIERLTDWSGIGTCLITCFLVALETNGASVHRMLMRIGGCLIGAALGFATVLLLMPSMTGLGDLLAVMAPPLLLAAWVKSGGDRSSYVGQQIAIAYYVCVLSGYGPNLDMESGRDRVIGILLGDVVVFIVYSLIWPVPVAGRVRSGLAATLRNLGDLIGARDRGAARTIRQRFDTAVEKTQDMLSNDPFDPASREARLRRVDQPRRMIDAVLMRQVQALIVPVLVVRAGQSPGKEEDAPKEDVAEEDVDDPVRRYRQDMKGWFGRMAAWVETGQDEEALRTCLPSPPDSEAGLLQADATSTRAATGRLDWCNLLDRDVRELLDTFALPTIIWDGSTRAV